MEHRVAIRDQWNESPWQALSNMRPSLAGTYTAHVADSQRSLTATRCSQYSARADSQKRRSPVPFKSPAGPSCGGAHTERMACRRLVFNETKAPAMHSHIDIDYVHSRANRSRDWRETTRVAETRTGTTGRTLECKSIGSANWRSSHRQSFPMRSIGKNAVESQMGRPNMDEQCR